MADIKTIKSVIKRDGTIIPFDKNKISDAIFQAAKAVGGSDYIKAQVITEKVYLNLITKGKEIPTIEDIQDMVERTLIQEGHASTAKQYILYRAKRQKDREQRHSILGYSEDIKIDLAGAMVAKRRYLEIGKDGSPEKISEMFKRVVKEIMKGEEQHKKTVEDVDKKFLEMMRNLEFMPGGRILANSGKKNRFLMNSFVLPVEDHLDEIYETLKRAMSIQKGGGGTGFDFSKLRPTGSITEHTESTAAGPISFLVLFNHASKTITNRGNRRGANMGVLRVDHPHIFDFITLKDKMGMEHFNISVGITDQFMEAVSKNQEYPIIDPHTGKEVDSLKARRILDLISTMAWKTADPGILFLDRINKDNPTPNLGRFETTDTCGEVPMYGNESTPLGSINLHRFVKEGSLDYDRLKEVTHLAVRFLDDAIDASWYPYPEIEETTKKFRRIGLGVMGWADLLYAMKIPYNSQKAITLAREVMSFIQKEADLASQQLAKERGVFPAHRGSSFSAEGKKRRNATVTAIAPTGSISLLVGTSSSIEPNYALSTMRQLFGTQRTLIVNKELEKAAYENNIYSEALMKEIAEKGSLKKIEGIPEEMKSVFVVAHDIEPKWHLKMQAAFQESVEGAISKTINFPKEASMQEIYEAFTEAYKLGLKGISIYRDGSKDNQVLQRAY